MGGRRRRKCRAAVLALGVLLAAGCGGGGGAGGLVSQFRTDASLTALTVSAGTLSPAFAPATTDYDVGPAVLPATVTVTPTTASATATVEVNGVATASGSPSAAIPLAMGTTAVSVVVTAEDRVTTRIYTVTFDRTSQALAGLALSAGTLSPAFDHATTAYTVGPAALGSTLVLTPTAQDAGASIDVGGSVVASGNPSPPLPLDFGPNPVAVTVTARDGVTQRTYTIVVARVPAQEAYLKASNTDAGDQFGLTLALSGDTLAVGAPTEASAATGIDGNALDDSAADSGAVYVFVRTGSTWSQQGYVKASNTGAGDAFGARVSLSGDTLVVGADNEDSAATGVDGTQSDDSASNSGAAYVFVRSGSTWSQQAYLKASNCEAGDQFGSAVAVDGDTIVVSATMEDSDATGIDGNQANALAPEAGAVYVFVRSGVTWSQQAYVKASNTGAQDRFGSALSLSGETFVAGAVLEASNATGVNGNEADNGAAASGAVYVFVRSGGAWAQQAYVKASNTEANDQFGFAVALSGDTLAVGAPDEDSSGTVDPADNSLSRAGAVYVFLRTASAWAQQAYLKASNPGVDDRFGRALGLSADTLVVGSQFEDSAATGVDGDQGDNTAQDAGAAYLLRRTGAAWVQAAYLKGSNTEGNDRVGSSIAVSGESFVVGAIGEDSVATGVDGSQVDNSAATSGAAYAFR